jgi:hypothetical protein
MADPNEYFKGQTVRITGAFRVNGVLTDPDTITLTVKNPAGTETAYTYALAQLTRSSAGIFYRDVGLDKAGRWVYEWVGTGAVAASVQQTMICKSIM